MQIAVLGLAGDPPHEGHKSLMWLASQYVDEVWLMPCYLHKFKKPIASPEQRLAMCQMIGKTSDYEIVNRLEGYTFELVNGLRRDFPQYEFSIVIGQDNANHINHWVRWEELIGSTRFIVMPRGDRKVLKDWYLHNGHIFVNEPNQEYSSTEIRKLIANKNFEEAAKHLDAEVLKYILENELYV